MESWNVKEESEVKEESLDKDNDIGNDRGEDEMTVIDNNDIAVDCDNVSTISNEGM